MFELNGEHEVFPVHMDLNRLFKLGEVHRICQEALAGAPEGLDTRELGLAVVRAKGLDEGDAVLRKGKLSNCSGDADAGIAGTGEWTGKRKGVRVWGLQ